MDITGRLQEFSQPGMEYRGAPFWSWNAKLEPEELRRQIRVMRDMGMGGFFMHSRVGLDTEYLSKEWFDCIRACVDEAGKQGMAAWLYDEDRWPSGAAGGIVSAEDKHRMKFLACEIVPPGAKCTPDTFTLACYAAVVSEDTLLSYRRLADGEEPGEGEVLVRIYWLYHEKDSWFNGQSYIDTMDPETIQRFIEVTHERYLKEVGKDFGGIIPGVFSDEPCYCHGNVADRLPWSNVFAEAFRKRHGYDLLENAPELFFKLKEAAASIRLDYHDTAASLLADAFSAISGKWCEKNKLQFTGHILYEDTLAVQTIYSGSAMRFYEYMQIPGIDLLTDRWNIFNTAKQCSSVARQLGRRRRLTETYGCTGWGFPLFGHKALGDWQYALGINLRCHHLYWYSMAAQAKRDYPASIAEHSPWHKKYSVVEDYFARIGSLTATDKEVRDLLVIHPIESAWSMMYRASTVAGDPASAAVPPGKRQAMPIFAPPDLQELDRRFNTLTNRLLGAHLDFDFGEEYLLERYARVVSAGVFRVGEAEYRAVLIPRLTTIRSTTVKLLADFARMGGRVFYLGPEPSRLDGRVSDEAKTLFREHFTRLSSVRMIRQLERVVRRVSIAAPGRNEAAPVLYRLGESKDASTLFICNTGMEFSEDILTAPSVRDRRRHFPQLEVAVNIPKNGGVYEASLTDGTLRRVKYKYGVNGYRFTTSLPELGSRMFIITSAPVRAKNSAKPVTAPSRRMPLPQKEWEYHLDEANVLVLDQAGFAVDGARPGEKRYFIAIDRELRDMLGVPRRGGKMVQPWKQRMEEKPDGRTLDLLLEYTFDCKEIPANDCRLVVEHPEYYRFELNGKVLPAEEAGCWICRDLPALKLPAALLKRGRNILRLRCDYSAEMAGLESLFILGDFGVDSDYAITALPETLDCADVVKQGLPCYSGNLTLKHRFSGKDLTGRKVVLAVDQDEWRGTMLGVRINGKPEIRLAWPPYTADLTGMIKAGQNTLEITVYGSRRNSFGPFYCKEEPPWVGAVQFVAEETEGVKQLTPFGLLAAPVLEVGEGK